jgi:hypothetical protein
MTEKLSPKERARFDICKKTIADNIQGVFDTGAAFVEIKTTRLYREEFESFKEFCEQVYHIGEAYAYRLAEASEVKENLPKSLGKLITNEAQARELAKVPEHERPKVLKAIVSEGETVTAASIKSYAGESQTSPIGEPKRPIESGKTAKPPIELDATGWPIPKDALPHWARRQEVQDLMTAVSRVKTAIVKAKANQDNLFAECSNAAIADLTKAYTHIENAKPYAVCTECQGSPSVQPKGCFNCRDTGLISEFKWNTHSRKEIKEMRLKQIKK